MTQEQAETTTETVKAKRTRKPVKKFFIHFNNKVISDLVASEVAGFLSSNEGVNVFDQDHDNTFDLTLPTVNEKFQAKAVIAYQG